MIILFLSYFFVKKIPLSRRVRVCYERVNGWVSEWVSEWEMYVFHTNQLDKQPIKFLVVPGKWCVRRFDPDIVQYGHIYSSIKEGEVFIYWAYFHVFCGLCRGRACDKGSSFSHQIRFWIKWVFAALLLLVLGKKEEMTEGRKAAGKVKQNRLLVAQGLDLPLAS